MLILPKRELIKPTRRQFIAGAAATAAMAGLPATPAFASWGSGPLASTTFQTPTGGATGTSNTNGGSAIDTTGAKLLTICVGMAAVSSDPITWTDNYSNTWALADGYFGPFGYFSSAIYYCKNPSVGPGYIATGTCAVNTFYTAILDAWSDGDSSAPLDGTATNHFAQASPPIQPGSVTPANANSLILTAFGPGLGNATVTIDSGFATPVGAIINALGNAYGGFRSFLEETSIAAQNPSWDCSNALNMSTTIVTFKPGSSPPPATGFVMPMSIP